MWLKYKFFEKGISPYEFRKCRIKDIKEVISIMNAMDNRAVREAKIREMIGRMK